MCLLSCVISFHGIVRSDLGRHIFIGYFYLMELVCEFDYSFFFYFVVVVECDEFLLSLQSEID